MKKIFLTILIVCSLFSCSEEDISEGSSSVLGDANTVVSFSPLGKWPIAPMFTDSEGYLYTFMKSTGANYQANTTDRFSINSNTLVKTNNKRELIWKVNLPNISNANFTIVVDIDNNIFIPVTNLAVYNGQYIDGINSNEEVWFKISSGGVTEVLSLKQNINVVKEFTFSSDFTIQNLLIAFDEDGYSYNVGSEMTGTEVFITKKDTEGNEVSSFKIPLINGRGHEIKAILYYNNALYVAVENFIEIKDDRLIAYTTGGFRNIFLRESYIAKFNSGSGDRIWFQKLVSNYVPIEDEFIGEVYTEVLKPSINIDNLTQDNQGNIWFNFTAYVKQDIGNTIGIETTFGSITTTLNAGNGGGTYTNLVQIQP